MQKVTGNFAIQKRNYQYLRQKPPIIFAYQFFLPRSRDSLYIFPVGLQLDGSPKKSGNVSVITRLISFTRMISFQKIKKNKRYLKNKIFC